MLLHDLGNDSFRDGHSWIEAQKEIKALEEDNLVLSARVAELESRLKHQHQLKFKPNRKAADSPDKSKRNSKKPRRRGAPLGHPPWQRSVPNRVDRSVDVPAPAVCPHCEHEDLSAIDKEHIQIQEDIVLQPITVVTQYRHQLAYCPNCRRDVFQTADGELRNCSIGPITKAVAVYMRHEVKLSYRDIQKVFTGLFGMPFVPASAMAFSHRTAEQGMHLYEDLRNKIRAANIVHGDETHWRIDGQGAQLWYAGNPHVAFYHADYSRGSEVAVSIFGTAFQGNLVADSYAGYNAINPKRRQACLAHLKRKAKDIQERIELMPKKKQDAKALNFCNSLSKFFSLCCRIDQRRKNDTTSFSAAKAFIPELQRTLNTICLRPMKDADTENLRKRLTDPKRDALKLFTFLKVNGMPPTNNHAEQALRLPVIFRKISFGSRSLFGAQSLAVNLSLLTTAKRQQRDPVDLFNTLLLQGLHAPLDAIYNPAFLPKFDSS
jgi:transposase